MRKYDIPYVPNGPVNYYPAKSLQEMTLVEIKKKYIKTCAKANGDVSEENLIKTILHLTICSLVTEKKKN